MGVDIVEHKPGEFSKAVFIKGGSGDPGLYQGTVDSVTAVPTFTVDSLAGYGNNFFVGWYAYVVWDCLGSSPAPEGESQVITDYMTANGAFTHAAFTVPLTANDKVLISLTDPNASGGDATAANQTTIISGQEGGVNAVNRVAGETQVKGIYVGSAANAAADTTLVTVTTQPCIILGVALVAYGAQTADLTSCPIVGGASEVLTFIPAADAIQANLNAANKQLGWNGEVYLTTGSTIKMQHNGTGATALDLHVSIRYVAESNGGYLA
ncbi:MAG: hypothetical protein U9Q68_03830 [Euryarchaeota archaeon]|nr:hypothetical protein [Euryarchaeota archaeon]